MNANKDHLLKKASSFFVLVSILSAWVLYRLVTSAGGGPSPRGASPAGDAAPPLLRRSDSLYEKLNLSTTPIVVEEYKLLYFGIEKVGSTVSETRPWFAFVRRRAVPSLTSRSARPMRVPEPPRS